jgi:hypothetical protein
MEEATSTLSIDRVTATWLTQPTTTGPLLTATTNLATNSVKAMPAVFLPIHRYMSQMSHSLPVDKPDVASLLP